MGQVYYTLPDDLYDEKYAKITDTLLRFGEYSNVGGGRTAGFGVISYKPYRVNRSDAVGSQPFIREVSEV